MKQIEDIFFVRTVGKGTGFFGDLTGMAVLMVDYRGVPGDKA